MRNLIFACIFICLASTASAQSEKARTEKPQTAGPSFVKVTGEVRTPLTLAAADIAAMPRTTVSAKDKQGAAHSYTGVALSDIFKKAGVTMGSQLRGKNM
ncbi:MAG TPA: hypothetical protein VGQ51_08085, partial [Puia sp.]|nr:hypothetical protein [Puia sp.]